VSSPRLAVGPNPKRALVTGASGYFGGLLARFLADRDVEVIGLDRLDDPEPDPRIRVIRADLRRPDEVHAVFEGQGPFEAVFHCATLLGHERPDPRELWECNVTGTRNVAEASLAHGAVKVVHTSTICVYGRSYPTPVREDEPTCPVEIYGRSKLEAERVLSSLSGRLDADSIRCPTIVSAGRLGLLAILFEFVKEGRRIYVVGDGSNRYQFVYAPDLAEACLLAARSPGSHIYHVGSDDVKPLREVYGAVIDEAGSASRLVNLPAWPAISALAILHRLGVSPLGPYHSRLIAGTFVFDTGLIKRNLGWQPTLSNDAMLREAYRFFDSHDTSRSDHLAAHRQGAKMGALRLLKWLS